MLIERKKRPRSIIPLPSMADIAFILLIFFLLTSTIDIEREIRVDLPETEISVNESRKYFHVWINREGNIFLKGKKNSLDQLYTYAKYRSSGNPDVRTLIGADRTLSFNKIYAIMETLREAGVHNIVLISKKKSVRQKSDLSG